MAKSFLLSNIITSQKAFTLIELLVVVAIIGLLASIGISSFSGSLARARDAKRLSDMKEIKDALKRYYIDHNSYPGKSNEGIPNTGQKIGVGSTIDNVLSEYMESVPQDPRHDGSTYFYSYDPRHCTDEPSGSYNCDNDPSSAYNCSGPVAATLAFHTAEVLDSSELRKDTCTGGNQKQHQADYNVALFPAPN